jgi:glycosyltransferase involved in cell wall biosynthesis
MHLLVPGKTNFRVMNDALALVAAGYAVTIVDVVPTIKTTREEYQGITFKHIGAKSWFEPSRWKPWFLVKAAFITIRCILVVLATRADIYHAHVEHAFCAAWLAANLWHSGLIFDTPELTLYDPKIIRWPRLRWLARTLVRRLAARCDLYITGSPAYVPILRQLYGSQHFAVIRHMSPRHTSQRSNRLSFPGLPEHTRIALYQGYLLPDRGLPMLVHAARFLNDHIAIVIMGQPFGSLADELHTMIETLGVEERVKIVPAVPYSELLDWTASADLGLLLLPPDYSLSINKCLPNKFFEYLQAGLPILSSRLEVVAPLIKRYQLGRVLNDLTPQKIATTINDLLSEQQREYWQYLHIRTQRTVAERRWYWEEEQQRLVRAYQFLWQRRYGSSSSPVHKHIARHISDVEQIVQSSKNYSNR